MSHLISGVRYKTYHDVNLDEECGIGLKKFSCFQGKLFPEIQTHYKMEDAYKLTFWKKHVWAHHKKAPTMQPVRFLIGSKIYPQVRVRAGIHVKPTRQFKRGDTLVGFRGSDVLFFDGYYLSVKKLFIFGPKDLINICDEFRALPYLFRSATVFSVIRSELNLSKWPTVFTEFNRDTFEKEKDDRS